MAFRELTMIEIREVLRRHASGQSLRQIARETGLDRKTVRRYVEASEQARADVSDGGVQEVAHRVQARPLPPRSEQRSVLVPHLEPLRKWLCEDELRLTKVHALLKRRGVEVSYPTLRRFVIDELGWHKQKPTVRLDDPPPGQEAQIDFALMGMVDDPSTGRRRKLWALLVTLSFSRHMFVWPTFEQTTASVIEGLDAAWDFFGGVVRCVLPDNMKAIVITADHAAPKIQQVFAEYAQHSGFFVDPARVRKPRDKARVENQVQHVRCSWFSGERFLGLTHSRKDAERWCRDIAGTRVHGTTREVPVERFDEKERAALLPLPQTRFDIPHWTEAKSTPTTTSKWGGPCIRCRPRTSAAPSEPVWTARWCASTSALSSSKSTRKSLLEAVVPTPPTTQPARPRGPFAMWIPSWPVPASVAPTWASTLSGSCRCRFRGHGCGKATSSYACATATATTGSTPCVLVRSTSRSSTSRGSGGCSRARSAPRTAPIRTSSNT